MGIFEILLILIIAVIVIPPDDLPHVMRAVGKVLRELRLASNTVMRELSSTIGDDSPYNLLPPRTAVTQSAPAPATQSMPNTGSPPAALPTTAIQAAPDTRPEDGSHSAPVPEPASVSSAKPAISSAPEQAAAPAADVKP